MVLHYPLQLGLAYLFLVGYFLRTLFISVKLPGAVGVILSGFLFSFILQEDIFAGRDHLQGLAFFLVLLTAGFEIKLADLRPYILICAVVPAAIEMLGLAAFAWWRWGYTPIESLVLATTLFCLGDGLVIPKMGEFSMQFPGHPLPHMVFTWAPLEASFGLTLFGILGGLAEPAEEHSVSIGLTLFANLLRLVATLTVGALVGAATGYLMSRRTKVSLAGRRVFNGSSVEAYLLILAVALGMFGAGTEECGEPILRMGFASGSLLQPELLIIVIGCLFGHFVDPGILEKLEHIVGGVWVFGQLILFSMLGSRTEIAVLCSVTKVLPLMAIGLSLRFVGVVIAIYSTLWLRPCTCAVCMKANKKFALHDAMFCFLSTLPRATIQGALGQQPMIHRFFASDSQRTHVRDFISRASKVYIVVMSILGSIFLDALGPRLLQCSERTERCLREEAHLLVEDGREAQHERDLALAATATATPAVPQRMDSSGSVKEKRSRASSKLRSYVRMKRKEGMKPTELDMVDRESSETPAMGRTATLMPRRRNRRTTTTSIMDKTSSIMDKTSSMRSLFQFEYVPEAPASPKFEAIAESTANSQWLDEDSDPDEPAAGTGLELTEPEAEVPGARQ